MEADLWKETLGEEDMRPLAEERLFDIDIIQCIMEDSMVESEVSQLEEVVEHGEHVIDQDLPVADENSILEKFLTKRSPRKFNKLGDRRLFGVEGSLKDDFYSVANNFSCDGMTEKQVLEEMKLAEADEMLQEMPRR